VGRLIEPVGAHQHGGAARRRQQDSEVWRLIRERDLHHRTRHGWEKIVVPLEASLRREMARAAGGSKARSRIGAQKVAATKCQHHQVSMPTNKARDIVAFAGPGSADQGCTQASVLQSPREFTWNGAGRILSGHCIIVAHSDKPAAGLHVLSSTSFFAEIFRGRRGFSRDVDPGGLHMQYLSRISAGVDTSSRKTTTGFSSRRRGLSILLWRM